MIPPQRLDRALNRFTIALPLRMTVPQSRPANRQSHDERTHPGPDGALNQALRAFSINAFNFPMSFFPGTSSTPLATSTPHGDS